MMKPAHCIRFFAALIMICAFSLSVSGMTGGLAHAAPAAKNKIEINFRQTDIMAVLEFYSHLMGKTFIPNHQLTGPVTVISPKPVTKLEALRLLYSVLDMKGYTLVQQGGYYKVVSKSEAVHEGLNVDSITIGGDQMVTEVLMLEYLQAADVIADFKQILSPEGSIFSGKSNNYIVFTDTAANVQKLKMLIRQIDKPGSLPISKTYSLQYVEAKTVAPMLTKLYTQQAAKSGKGVVEILAMDETNSLIVLAPESVHKDIAKIVGDLDVRTMQVSIKAYLVEVSLTDDTKLGIEWMFNVNSQGTSAGGSLDFGRAFSSAMLGGTQEALNFSIVNGDSFQAMMNFFASNENARVVSAPHIVALDNQKASISVGTEIPILKLTQTSMTSQQNVIKTYDHRKFGMQLDITPTIAENRDVTLKIDQTLSSLVTDDTDPDQWKSTDRAASTTVLVKDAQTLVIGGLMSADGDLTKKGAPYLKDMPILGPLFGAQEDKIEKSELLLFLTPYVIATPDEADAMSGLRTSQSPMAVDEFGLVFDL
ncbi:secretin N-terminal domain-containing protein [Maridesulfovibrio sp.]|uniref:secretin N-terminal domain-containing protein n=1 Tax=Maridesulfovibrio sp. TaxID=2795000 RepID=UPI002AA936F5|nr:secretin N-terminal domain-containing protein [Maridesulfovibrio sp.]